MSNPLTLYEVLKICDQNFPTLEGPETPNYAIGKLTRSAIIQLAQNKATLKPLNRPVEIGFGYGEEIAFNKQTLLDVIEAWKSQQA